MSAEFSVLLSDGMEFNGYPGNGWRRVVQYCKEHGVKIHSLKCGKKDIDLNADKYFMVGMVLSLGGVHQLKFVGAGSFREPNHTRIVWFNEDGSIWRIENTKEEHPAIPDFAIERDK